MYPAVIKVIPESNYTLLLTFNNGDKRRFDVKPYLHLGVFRQLSDVMQFNKVKVSFDTVEWENEADIDPEILYKNSEKV